MADKTENKNSKGRVSRLIRRMVEGYRERFGRLMPSPAGQWWQPMPIPAPVPVRASQPMPRVTRRRRY